jgi:ribose-phosphate pyrophosphokinase
MIGEKHPKVFALKASRAYGEMVAASMGVPLSTHEERSFEDGEHKTRPLESVRGDDVFVIQSLYDGPDESVNDKLCRLLFFCGALLDAAASSVTVLAPYLCYARKDRKTKFRDPVTMRYVAQLCESVGIAHVVTLDVHNLAAFQNAFRCRTDHLEARMLFVDHFAPLVREGEAIVISPDEGGLKRADSFRRALSARLGRDIPLGFSEKRRSAGVVSGGGLHGDVKGRTAIIIDDLIATGTTLVRAAAAARSLGATHVYAAATHGLFIGAAGDVLSVPVLDQVVVTDSVPPFRLAGNATRDKLVILPSAPLFAEAARRIHVNGSVSALLGPED